ncbi:VWA domain-containing protein [Halegenticoccus tardaugens]|uniref:VWA domain-containing protein n=1 Tax=Halegenticoccus tardaugens TaxID=2071624 RepID=UPI00100B01ED|nr:VWA domain-containing protein [Halegenticoccus tardaugens]
MTDVPDFVAACDHVREELVRFLRTLRRARVSVPANAGTTAARALIEVGFDNETTARAALRAAVVTDADDIATFDRQFPEFWRRLRAGLNGEPAPQRDDTPEGMLAPQADESAEDLSPEPEDEGETRSEEHPYVTTMTLEGAVMPTDDGEERGVTEAAWYSPTGSAMTVESASAGEPSLSETFDTFGDALATLKGWRWQSGGSERADARRALRSSFGTGGTVVSMPWRTRPTTEYRALWLIDVSRSVLDTVDRSFLLGVLRYARVEWRDSRVVFFDEDCCEVSTTFDELTAAAALDSLAAAEIEWGGGTRIGASLANLRERDPDAVDGRTVVFLVSDGLEMGDVNQLEREMAWLSRHAASVLWLNPLASSPAFEPTAAGMAAAIPFVDGLFAFSGPADLEELGRQLRRYSPNGRIGFEYDPRRGTSYQ